MTVKVISYSKGKLQDHGALDYKKAAELKDDVVWVDITKPSREDMAMLGEAYGFHTLALDDCLHAVQRTKMEEYGGNIFMVFKILGCCDHSLNSTQLSMFIGGNYLVTISSEENSVLSEIKAKILAGGHKALTQKTDYLLYLIIDKIVDDYFIILDKIEEDFQEVEDEVTHTPTPKTVEKLFKIKKDLLYFRKPIWPTREVLHLLQSGQVKYLGKELIPYYRDIYDHIIQLIDLVETYRDLASSAMDIYLSTISNSLNKVIKLLTVLASIFLIPTLISGIYGMNYKLIPDNGWQYGFHFTIILMILSMSVTWLYFKRKGWV